MYTSSTATKVMIATGNSGTVWNPTSGTKTEIVDVVSGVTCSDLADFPVEFLAGTTGANLDGTPIVCGGALPSSEYLDKCYRFTNGVWEDFTSLKEGKKSATAVVYNRKLHVFGGRGGYSKFKTSEIINVDGGVSYGPELPRIVSEHAMTSINDTVSIISGGSLGNYQAVDYFTNQTWYYNHETESFTPGPNLLEGRELHGSATNVDKVTKAKVAVVAGGYNGASTRLDSTELLINGQWQTGTVES